MTTSQKFETKIYDSEDGWRIWLVTNRTAWDKVESMFKIQYWDGSELHMRDRVCRINGYHDTASRVQHYLRTNEQWVHIWISPNYCEDIYSRYFVKTMNELYKTGELKQAIDVHNRKTMHKLEYLPDYKVQDDKHLITILHDPEEGKLITLDMYKLDGLLYTAVYAIMENNAGAALKTQTRVTNPMLRPESVSNEVFRAINPLMDAIKLSVDDRKDMVAEVREFFENSRFAFWRLLNVMNKPTV